MKIGVSVSVYENAKQPWVYSGPEFLKNMKEAKSLGVDILDLFVNRMCDVEIERVKNALDYSDSAIAMFVPFFIGGMKGSFGSSDKNMRRWVIEEYLRQIDVASYLGAKTMPVGYNRGNLEPGQKWDEYCRILADSLSELTEAAAAKNITVCVEPINHCGIGTLNTIAETADYIDKYKIKGLKILADFFHMNIDEADMAQALIYGGDKIAHVHVPDSNRLAPGLGHVDYKACLSALKKIGYDECISAEALPGSSPKECTKQTVKYLKKILSEI